MEDYSIRNYYSLPPEKRKVAEEGLRKTLGPENLIWVLDKLTDKGTVMDGYFHFSGGMAVRNILRENGHGEEFFEIDNLDDYYEGLLEKAAQLEFPELVLNWERS